MHVREVVYGVVKYVLREYKLSQMRETRFDSEDCADAEYASGEADVQYILMCMRKTAKERGTT